MNIPMIPADKARHVSYGALSGMLGSFVGYLLFYRFGTDAWIIPACAAGAAIAVGLFKDFVIDEAADVRDVLATLYGGLFVAIPLAVPLVV
jgi:hypothetical protein